MKGKELKNSTVYTRDCMPFVVVVKVQMRKDEA
jgi:hypothetical protein